MAVARRNESSVTLLVSYDEMEVVQETAINEKSCKRGGGSVAEWLAFWTQAQKGLGSNRSSDAVG